MKPSPCALFVMSRRILKPIATPARVALFGVFILCVLLSASGIGQEANAPATSSSQKSYAISGSVVNGLTGEPVRHAAVYLQGPQSRSALTDASGHFEMDGITDEHALLIGYKPGLTDGAHSGGRALVAVDRSSPQVQLKMYPAGVIFGRLTNREQQPLEGFSVQAVGKQVEWGRLAWIRLFQSFAAVTDENGEFRLYDLPAGTYYLHVDQRSQETTLSQAGVVNAREQVYASAYYPGVADVRAATPIEVTYGREVEANITLSPEPLYNVTGMVGNEMRGLQSIAFSRNAGEEWDYSEGASVTGGNFQIKLPAGSYRVAGGERDGTPYSANMNVDSDIAGVHVAFAPTPSIEVQIRTKHAGGAALQQVSSGESTLMGMAIELTSEVGIRPWDGWWDPRTKSIQNVQPGKARLRIVAPAPWWVKSAQCGGVDLLAEDLTIPQGGVVPPIEVTLQDGAGSVQGKVVPEDPLPVAVLLVQKHGERNVVQQTNGIGGSFSFPAVAPGEYALVAFRFADQIEYQNPAVLNPYLSDAPRVTVPANGIANAVVSVSMEKH